MSSIASYVLMTEILGSDARASCSMAYQSFFTVGMMLVSPISYAVPYWRHLQIAIGLLSLPMVLIISMVDESPRYLVSKGRFSKAEQCLDKIARRNGKIVGCLDLRKLETGARNFTENKTSVVDLFRNGARMTCITLTLGSHNQHIRYLRPGCGI